METSWGWNRLLPWRRYPLVARPSRAIGRGATLAPAASIPSLLPLRHRRGTAPSRARAFDDIGGWLLLLPGLYDGEGASSMKVRPVPRSMAARWLLLEAFVVRRGVMARGWWWGWAWPTVAAASGLDPSWRTQRGVRMDPNMAAAASPPPGMTGQMVGPLWRRWRRRILGSRNLGRHRTRVAARASSSIDGA